MAENEINKDLNDLNNLEKASTKNPFSKVDDASILYKNLIKSLSLYSKGELFTTDDIKNMIRNEYEAL